MSQPERRFSDTICDMVFAIVNLTFTNVDDPALKAKLLTAVELAKADLADHEAQKRGMI